MTSFQNYRYVPIGSLSLLPEHERLEHIESFQESSPKIKDILTAVETGSYIRGIGKTHNIPDEYVPKISQIILFIATGKKNITELGSTLSKELQLPSHEAHNMASEIEKDIFGPIKGELDAFLASQKGKSTPIANTAAAAPTLRLAPLAQGKPNNLLDLKEITAAKKQAQLASPPKQKSLPQRSEQPQAPKFPLPARPPSNSVKQAPKPPVSPLNFSGY